MALTDTQARDRPLHARGTPWAQARRAPFVRWDPCATSGAEGANCAAQVPTGVFSHIQVGRQVLLPRFRKFEYTFDILGRWQR